MDIIIELLKEINVAQVFAIGTVIWFFYRRLDDKIDKVDQRLNEAERRLSDRIDKLSEKVENIDRRLCRIEGGLSTHGHCLFNQSKPEQKAE